MIDAPDVIFILRYRRVGHGPLNRPSISTIGSLEQGKDFLVSQECAHLTELKALLTSRVTKSTTRRRSDSALQLVSQIGPPLNGINCGSHLSNNIHALWFYEALHSFCFFSKLLIALNTWCHFRVWVGPLAYPQFVKFDSLTVRLLSAI